MGYSSTVRTMVMDEMVWLNECSEGRMDAIVTDLGRIEREFQMGQQWSQDFTVAVRGMEVDIGGLMALTAFLRGEVDRMRVEMDALLGLNGRLVESILSLCVVVHHGCNNPTVIKDNKVEEGEVVEARSVSPVRTLVKGDHTLVEIVEETPNREIIDDWESSPEL